jgi:hypothetical protein
MLRCKIMGQNKRGSEEPHYAWYGLWLFFFQAIDDL